MKNQLEKKLFLELKERLISRDYPIGIINRAIAKARAIPRQKALLQGPRQPINTRPAFVVLYDPRLPVISDITSRHWRSMVYEEEYLKSVFPGPKKYKRNHS